MATTFLNLKTCPSFLYSKHHTLNFLNYQVNNNFKKQQELLVDQNKFLQENEEDVALFKKENGLDTRPVDMLKSYLQEMNKI